MSANVRKRSGSGGKKVLKEKIVEIYESLFRGDQIAIGNVNFWDEFFLLKPKMAALEGEIGKLQADQLAGMRDNLNILFHECVAHLSHNHQIRVVYALQTLVGVIKAVYKKCVQLSGFDLVNFLIGFDRAEQELSILISHVTRFLTDDHPHCLKHLCLQLLLVLTCGTDNVSNNTLLEYLMNYSVFDSLVGLLGQAGYRKKHGQQTVTVLALLVQYRKYESSNPYILQLSILDQELVLHGYSRVVTSSLAEYTGAYEASLTESSGSGWLGAFTNMMGNMFVSEDSNIRNEKMRSHNPSLLALYEVIHLNRNFITTLAQYQSDTETTPVITETNNQPEDIKSVNLLVTFLEYISIAMQDTKSDVANNNVTLCLIILMCLTEDQYAASIMHDPNLVFKVKLHRSAMRHRKGGVDQVTHGRSLVCALLDLLLEFIKSHLMKRLPFELHLLVLNSIHRLLAYQKRCRVRIGYNWRDLWATLIALLKFVVSNESCLNKKLDFFTICSQVIQIFNVFITYGDTFLPSASSYDELYYELVRCHQTFDNLHSMTLRYSTSGGEHKDTAMRITNSLVNIRAITSHFQPRIDAWLAKEQLSTPSEEQILDVVRDNYDSLTLKLQEGLDQYDNYVESPVYTSFFTTLVRSIVSDVRQKIVLDDLDLQDVLQNFSSIQ